MLFILAILILQDAQYSRTLGWCHQESYQVFKVMIFICNDEIFTRRSSENQVKLLCVLNNSTSYLVNCLYHCHYHLDSIRSLDRLLRWNIIPNHWPSWEDWDQGGIMKRWDKLKYYFNYMMTSFGAWLRWESHADMGLIYTQVNINQYDWIVQC